MRDTLGSWMGLGRVLSVYALILISAGHAASAAAVDTPCANDALHPATVDLLLELYHADSTKSEQVAEAISDQVIKELAVPAKHLESAASLVRRIVPLLLTQTTSAQQLNAQLAQTLAPLCTILAEEKNGPTKPDAGLARETVTLDDPISKALDAKRDAAKRTYAGTDNLTIPQPDMQKLAQYHSGMFQCDAKKPAPGCDFETEIDRSLCIGVEDKTAACSRRVFTELQRRDSALGKLHEEALAIKPDAQQTAEIADLRRASSNFYNNSIGLEGTRGPFYGLYAGPNFLLQDGGDWKEGVEVFASFNTEAFDRAHCPFAWTCRGFFDVAFVTPDTFPTEVEDDETLPVAVFDAKGRVRIRAGGQAHFNEYAGIEIGIGATSPISDQSSSVRAEPRVHIGAHFQTAYADRAIGEVFLGYARDKAWERLVDLDGNLATTADQVVQERFDRLLFEGTLIFPRLSLGGFSLAARLSADLPWSGDTQSELRTSILLYYPLNSWLDKFRPTEKTAETPAP